MPLGPHDLQALGSWSFLNDIQQHRTEFVSMGRTVYRALVVAFGRPPTRAGVEVVMAPVLLYDPLFLRLASQKPHVPAITHRLFATLIARFLVDREWPDITT